MDYKKVGTIRLGYYRSDGVWVEKDFQTELNDATFSGDVSSLTGTFRGTLTASAVNAAKNINIAGYAVARSLVLYNPSIGTYGQGSWNTVFSGSLNCPAHVLGEKKIIVAFYSYFWVDGLDNGGDEYTRLCHIQVLINGVVRYEHKGAAGTLHSHSNHWGIEFIAPANVGLNTVVVRFLIRDEGWNIYPRFKDRRMRMDLVYK